MAEGLREKEIGERGKENDSGGKNIRRKDYSKC